MEKFYGVIFKSYGEYAPLADACNSHEFFYKMKIFYDLYYFWNNSKLTRMFYKRWRLGDWVKIACLATYTENHLIIIFKYHHKVWV